MSPSLRQVVYALLTRLPLDSFSTLNAQFLVKHFIKVKLRLRRNDALSHFIKHSVLKTRLVRLACVKHAASVRPEPGSNSPINYIEEPIGSRY